MSPWCPIWDKRFQPCSIFVPQASRCQTGTTAHDLNGGISLREPIGVVARPTTSQTSSRYSAQGMPVLRQGSVMHRVSGFDLAYTPVSLGLWLPGSACTARSSRAVLPKRDAAVPLDSAFTASDWRLPAPARSRFPLGPNMRLPNQRGDQWPGGSFRSGPSFEYHKPQVWWSLAKHKLAMGPPCIASGATTDDCQSAPCHLRGYDGG